MREDLARGLAAILAHLQYGGASYPKELLNIEEGHIQAEDPEVLKQYEDIAKEYDRDVLKLHHEALNALSAGEPPLEVYAELARKQAQIALESLKRELDLPLRWSEQAKEEIRQGLAHLKAEAEEDEELARSREFQEFIGLLEELLQRR